jgi:hypothetical protein
VKLRTLALGALILLPAQQAMAQGHHHSHVTINSDDDDSPARPGPRHSLRDAQIAITTTDNTASFVLTRSVVALQLTERALREIRDGDDDDREDGVFASMIASAVRGTVASVLRHSIEVPVSDLRSVDYRNGRLIFVTEDGERIFEDTEINDTDVTASFSARDAQAFVREFRAMKARTR